MTWLLLCGACVVVFVALWAAAVLNGRTCGLRESSDPIPDPDEEASAD